MDEPLKALEKLGDEFERLAHQPRRGFRLPFRTSLLALTAATTVSAGALAASGILTGDPVRNPPEIKPTADAGTGLSEPTSARLTALRVADPRGGPPWGLRTMTTTRERGCVQVGRVVGGRLGVLGQDGAHGDDGRFHPVDSNVQIGRDCQPLDEAGRLFLAVAAYGLPASGDGSACRVREPDAVRPAPPGSPTPSPPRPPRCPPEDLRVLFYGTLGPDAESVRFRDNDGRLRTLRTSGPDGAYLVVVRPTERRPVTGSSFMTPSPATGLERVTYRDGTVCRVRNPESIDSVKACPRVGFVAPGRERVTPADVTAPVDVTVSPSPVASPAPARGPAPTDRVWAVRVTFTAPRAAGPSSSYLVEIRCDETGGQADPIDRNVRKGERVVVTTSWPLECRSGLRGQVRFRSRTPSPNEDPLATGPGVLTVGRFKVTVPPRP